MPRVARLTHCLALLALTSAALPARPPADGELRGAWMWLRSAATPAQAEMWLDRAETLGLNTIYALVYHWNGATAYRTDLAPPDRIVTADYDPLAYLVEHGHARGIDIHAWYVVGDATQDAKLKASPEWDALTAAGESADWFDLTNPAVRDYFADLMLDVLDRYAVDGVHFDYIRFPNKTVPYTTASRAGAQAAGIDLEAIGFERLPVAARLRGNPATEPTTATVLAEIEREGKPSLPAVAINRLGEGEVVLYNWHAAQDPSPAVQASLAATLHRLGAADGGPVHLLDSALLAARYGRSHVTRFRTWLTELGFEPTLVGDDDLGALPAGAVVVLPQHYVMTDEQARALIDHVRAGGGAVLVDAPVLTLPTSAAVQELIGFRGVGGFLNDFARIVARDGAEALLPVGGPEHTLAELRETTAAWAAWRKEQAGELVAEVGRRVREQHPDRTVSAAVFWDEGGADAVLQDWPTWVRDGRVDYVGPMSYLIDPNEYAAAFDWWMSIQPDLADIIPAIGSSRIARTYAADPAAAARSLIRQVRICREQNAPGFVFFKLEEIAPEIAAPLGQAIKAGP